MKRLIDILSKKNNVVLKQQELVDMLTKYTSPIEIQEYLGDLLSKSELNLTGYEHQLGFYKFIIADVGGRYPRRVRLHFWRRGQIEKDIHDHIASFASIVLQGTLTSTKFSISDLGDEYYRQDFVAVGDSCEPSTESSQTIKLIPKNKSTIKKGDVYYLNFNELHCAEPLSICTISLILQDSPVDRNIHVYRLRQSTSEVINSSRTLYVDEKRRILEEMHFQLGEKNVDE